MLLLGFDPLAARVARALVAGTTVSAPPRQAALVCEATGEGIAVDLRRRIIGLMEEARVLGEPFEPHLGLLVTASAPEGAAALQELRTICEMLQTLSAGNQSVALVVLLSSPAASDASRSAEFRFFLGLEALVGELPFLDNVFVHQCTHQDVDSDDGEISAELKTLVAAELLDSELRQVLASFGRAAVDWRTRVAGRKACYSTLGSYLLEYHPDDAQAYLSGRLQRQLLNEGLAAAARVDGDVRVALQAKVDEVTRNWLAAVTQRLPRVPTLSISGLADAADGETRDRQLAALPAEVERALLTLGPHFGLEELLDGWAKRVLVELLPVCPAELAGALAFMDALLGQRLTGEPGLASGVESMRKALCLDAFGQTTAAVGKRLLLSLDLGAADQKLWPDEMPLDWLDKAASALAQVAEAKRQPADAPARLLASLLHCLVQGSDVSEAGTLTGTPMVEDMVSAYLRESDEVLGRLAAARSACADTERAIAALPKTYGLIGRGLTRRAEFQAELAALEARRDGLSGVQQSLSRAQPQMRGILDTVVNEIVLERVLRERVVARVRRDVEQSAEELRAFVSALVDGVQARWDHGAAVGQEGRSTTGSRLLSDQRLEVHYARTLERGHIVFPQAVNDLLAFVPPAGRPVGGGSCSYLDCRDLKDHFLLGAGTLLERMGDYAQQQCTWVRDLDALDVIECQGKDVAARFLVEVCKRTQRHLELSPGLSAVASSKGCPQVIFVVRTAGAVARRLDAGYSQSFAPSLQFIESDDPRSIEVTGLVLGFPAFLIQMLHEGRRLALSASEGEHVDLWPC